MALPKFQSKPPKGFPTVSDDIEIHVDFVLICCNMNPVSELLEKLVFNFVSTGTFLFHQNFLLWYTALVAFAKHHLCIATTGWEFEYFSIFLHLEGLQHRNFLVAKFQTWSVSWKRSDKVKLKQNLAKKLFTRFAVKIHFFVTNHPWDFWCRCVDCVAKSLLFRLLQFPFFQFAHFFVDIDYRSIPTAFFVLTLLSRKIVKWIAGRFPGLFFVLLQRYAAKEVVLP